MPTKQQTIWTRSSLFAASLISAAAVLAAAAFTPKEETATLLGPPRDAAFYFIGNSMFGTGLDIEAAANDLPNERVILAYYDGQYTAFWYAALRNGLLANNIKPKVVIWGFRPTYAILPSFRQNRPTALDRFYDPQDEVFRKILASAEDRLFTGTGKRTNETIYGIIERRAPIIKQRTYFLDAYLKHSALSVASGFSKHNSAAAAFIAAEPSIKIADTVVAFGTQGALRRADALVIDNGERFVTGRKVKFGESFIPPIASLLKEAGVAQMIVIFKPVSVFDKPMPTDVASFYEDALSYFEAQDIAFLDFVRDDALKQSYFAKGDHYNQLGMEYVTSRIVNALYANNLATR